MRPSDADAVAIVDRSHQIVAGHTSGIVPWSATAQQRRGQQDFVATKIVEQVDLHTLHRVRERLMKRTGIMNEIRAFLLERGEARWSLASKAVRKR